MKKRLYITLFISFILLVLTSCSLSILDDGSSIKVNSKKLNYEVSAATYSNIEKTKSNCLNYLDVNYDKFEESVYEYIYYLYVVVDSMKKANVSYGIAGSSSAYSNYETLYNKYLELYKWYKSLLAKIKNSSFKDKFFEGYSEAEINEMCETYPDRYYELESKIDSLQNEFQALSNEEMINKAPSYIVTLVSLCNEEAKLLGYNNYLEYAYSNIYERDYTYEESSVFSNYVKEYIVPYAISLKESISTNNFSYSEKSALNTILDTDFDSNYDLMLDYATSMGNTYLKQYKYLINRGYLYKSTSSSGHSGAYTNYFTLEQEGVILLGYGYADNYSFIHEFGHYLTYNLVKSSPCFDVAEVESMGNEMMFTSYLINNYDMSDKAKEYLGKYKQCDFLTTSIYASVVNDFTIECFTKDDLTESDISTIYYNVLDSYGGYDYITTAYPSIKNYCYYTVVPQPGYYISYSVAGIESILLYKIAESSFINAKEIYLNIVNYNTSLSGISILTNAGLSDPFSEDTFKSIVS